MEADSEMMIGTFAEIQQGVEDQETGFSDVDPDVWQIILSMDLPEVQFDGQEDDSTVHLTLH